MTTNAAAAPRKAIQPTTGTVHFAVDSTVSLYYGIKVDALVSACSTMSIDTNRCSLSEVSADTEVTCKKCLAGAKAQAKAAASVAITDASGAPLKDGNGFPLRTVVAARNELSHQVQNVGWYNDAESIAHVLRLAEALRLEGTVDVDKVIRNAAKKVAKEGARHNALEALAAAGLGL